jgi:hypothetical protein
MSDSQKKKDATAAPTTKVGLLSSTAKSLDATDFLNSGWRVALALLIPAFLGIWLDERYQVGKLFTAIGVLFGVVVANIAAFQYVSTKFGGSKR